MADALEQQVEQLLLAGESKKTILARLTTDANHLRLLALLNNKPTLDRRRRYMWLNLALGAVLLAMTLKRLLAIAAAGHMDFYLLADFIVPTINFYVLRELLRFHRTGYRLLALLTGLALIYPANRILPDLVVHLGMIGTALFLHQHLFPAGNILTTSNKSKP